MRARIKIVRLDTLCEVIMFGATVGRLLMDQLNFRADFTGQFQQQMQQVTGLCEFLQFLLSFFEVGIVF